MPLRYHDRILMISIKQSVFKPSLLYDLHRANLADVSLSLSPIDHDGRYVVMMDLVVRSAVISDL